MGAGVLKGMNAAERQHDLTIEYELLAALPCQLKVG